MPLVTRYSDTIRGKMTLTGNTLGFSNNPPFSTGIGAFLSTIPAINTPGYPTPSTLNWQQNGSTAQLVTPTGSTIVYAELIWGGSSLARNPINSLPLATLDTPVIFNTPSSNNTIVPDPATAFSNITTDPIPQRYYTRSQNVTSLVQAAGPGTYEVKGVPATLNDDTNIADQYTTTAGWALIVVYSDPALAFYNLSINVGNVAISVYAPPVDTNISGFSVPSLGSINARVLVSAMQGDPNIDQDQLLLGKDIPSLVSLSGPNNPINNFFNSQVNNDLGLVDTTGSFGNLNSVAGVITPAVRSEWDITNVDASSAFVNSQNQAVIRLKTNYDTFAVSVFATEIQIEPANVTSSKTVDKSYAKVFDTLTYTVVLKNEGFVSADNVVITDQVPSGTTLVPGSLNLTASYTGSLATQINLNNSILPNAIVTMTYKVLVTKIPSPNPISNMSTTNYTSIPAPGVDPVPGIDYSNTVETFVNKATLVTKKISDKNVSYIGDTITYNISVTNTGNVPATNVVIADAIPVGGSYVSGSLVVNAAYSGSIGTGIILTNPIAPNQIVNVLFKVLIVAIPNPNPINNIALVNYTYTADPNNPDGISQTSNSNVVKTTVFKHNLSNQITDIINSISLQQAALGNIANAEGKKIQIAMAMNNITDQELLCVNKSVQEMLDSISLLESMLKQKLNSVSCQINPNSCL